MQIIDKSAIVDPERELMIVRGNVWDMNKITELTFGTILPLFWQNFGRGEKITMRIRGKNKELTINEIKARLLFFKKVYASGFMPLYLRLPRFNIGPFSFQLRHSYPVPYFIQDPGIFIHADLVLNEKEEWKEKYENYPPIIDNEPSIMITGSPPRALADAEIDNLRLSGYEIEKYHLKERGSSGLMERLGLSWDFPADEYCQPEKNFLKVEYISFDSLEQLKNPPPEVEEIFGEAEEMLKKITDEAWEKKRSPN